MNQLKYEQEFGLQDKLNLNRPLTVKLGFDPTSPDLHLGHYVVLKGARNLQEMGHNITIIVGDFTASIGDPSGRNKLRPPLTDEEIKINAKTYTEQVFMVLDKEKTKIAFNGEWLNKMDVKDMLAILSSVTVSQILVRDDFKKRFEAQTPIHMHEMVYPLMQGLDSVMIKADIELGGTDQTFNLMMGRQLQKDRKMQEQAVVTFPLLVGLDGKKKMSKSLNNHIGLRDTPKDMFGKIMSISDETMWNYWSILAENTEEQIEIMKNSGDNFKNIKLSLASYIVGEFHGFAVAMKEKQDFIDRFSNKKVLDVEDIEVFIDGDDIGIPQLIKDLNLASSVSDAGRKMEQNGVKINSETVSNKKQRLVKNQDVLLQVGKLHIKNVKLR